VKQTTVGGIKKINYPTWKPQRHPGPELALLQKKGTDLFEGQEGERAIRKKKLEKKSRYGTKGEFSTGGKIKGGWGPRSKKKKKKGQEGHGK